MSRPLITALPAYGPSRGGNHPKTLRGPVGKERPAGPRSHTGMPAYPRVIAYGRGDHPTYPPEAARPATWLPLVSSTALARMTRFDLRG